MIDPATLRVGDRVRIASLGTQHRATVEDVTENYVKLLWGVKRAHGRGDMLLKTSPLWLLMEPVT